MRSFDARNSFVTFVGQTGGQQGIRFSGLEIRDADQTMHLNLHSQINCLRPQITKLAQDLLSNSQNNPTRRQPFLCRVGELQFEDYTPIVAADGSVTVQLRLTKGKILDFFQGKEEQDSLPELEDVFLPLTNLAAYLRAVGDTPNGSPGPQALHLTADRIDEFLLIYGGRLLDKAHSETSSVHVLF